MQRRIQKQGLLSKLSGPVFATSLAGFLLCLGLLSANEEKRTT